MNSEMGKAIAVLGPEVVQALIENNPDDQWELDFIKELISVFENSSPGDWGSWLPFLMVNDLLDERVLFIEVIDWQFARVGRATAYDLKYTLFQRMDRPTEPVNQSGFSEFGMSTVIHLKNLREMAKHRSREIVSELLTDCL